MTGPIVVWGAGAIGGTIGAALARAGEDVIFVDRDADHVAAINSGGIQIIGPVDPHVAVGDGADARSGRRHLRPHPALREGARHRSRGAQPPPASRTRAATSSRSRTA